jgi:hypothetical protein
MSGILGTARGRLGIGRLGIGRLGTLISIIASEIRRQPRQLRSASSGTSMKDIDISLGIHPGLEIPHISKAFELDK